MNLMHQCSSLQRIESLFQCEGQYALSFLAQGSPKGPNFQTFIEYGKGVQLVRKYTFKAPV